MDGGERKLDGDRGHSRCEEGLWRDAGHPWCGCQHPRRRVRCAGWPLRLREIHASAHDRRAREHLRRRDPDRQPRHQRDAAEGTGHRHGVPELRAVSPHDGGGQHGLLPQAAQSAEGGDRRPGEARGGDPQSLQAARSLPPPALRRPAPARRHGPRHRARSAGVPVRRAALQPRRPAARADAHRDQGAAPAAEDHHRLRHPRPDRGHDHGRQDRGDARRHRRADRRAARSLRPAGQPVRRRLHRLPLHELHQGQGAARRHPARGDVRRREHAAAAGRGPHRRPGRRLRAAARAHPSRSPGRADAGGGDRAHRLGDPGGGTPRRRHPGRGAGSDLPVPGASLLHRGRGDPHRPAARPHTPF